MPGKIPFRNFVEKIFVVPDRKSLLRCPSLIMCPLGFGTRRFKAQHQAMIKTYPWLSKWSGVKRKSGPPGTRRR